MVRYPQHEAYITKKRTLSRTVERYATTTVEDDGTSSTVFQEHHRENVQVVQVPADPLPSTRRSAPRSRGLMAKALRAARHQSAPYAGPKPGGHVGSTASTSATPHTAPAQPYPQAAKACLTWPQPKPPTQRPLKAKAPWKPSTTATAMEAAGMPPQALTSWRQSFEAVPKAKKED